MVISERRKYCYLEDDEIVVNKIRDKYRRKEKKRINPVSKLSFIVAILLVFFLSILLLNQYSKVNAINSQIIEIENELEEVRMMNDTKEGMIISRLDLNEIERIAKEDLGMVEPSAEQYSYIAINDNSLRADSHEEEKESEEKRADNLSWFSRLID